MDAIVDAMVFVVAIVAVAVAVVVDDDEIVASRRSQLGPHWGGAIPSDSLGPIGSA